MKDEIAKWAEEVVKKIVEAERLGGGFRLYHEQAAREIADRVRNAEAKAKP